MTFSYHNPPAGAEPPPSAQTFRRFTMRAPPGCDMWRKPPAHDAFDAPICYRTMKLSAFRRARVTVSAAWKTLFDQGGLCLVLPAWPSHPTDGDAGHAQGKPPNSQWVKTGIEFFAGKPFLSTVACDNWADWSLWPIDGGSVTVEMERERKTVPSDGDGGGGGGGGSVLTNTMWIYLVEGDRRTPVREISWVFDAASQDQGGDGAESLECWVGMYVAKPRKDEDSPDNHLEVSFDDLEVVAE